MKVLHIMRSEPDETTRMFMATMFQDSEVSRIQLYDFTTDYSRLVEQLFAADKVVSWW